MRYFYYNINGKTCLKNTADLISEVKLPRFSADPKFKGKCSFFSRHISPKLKVRQVVDIAFGDPRILRGCKKLSLKRNPCPILRQNTSLEREFMVVFKFQGTRFWADRRVLCLLKDLK